MAQEERTRYSDTSCSAKRYSSTNYKHKHNGALFDSKGHKAL
ncbi:hypothetical protein HMPREF9193_01390 [Treponema lecithinolyticum ATCC 700332]|uniref:Uncharacterized protein n=1 Tax=Treponema lecithinolyticum ATCC 700332 TaxID=1321815 RepID=A0ABN0NYC0_TRELE|nr:hypothetical protein HMPREF9193_01390 [Treponema lecithinolyticum ATCC 700332]